MAPKFMRATALLAIAGLSFLLPFLQKPIVFAADLNASHDISKFTTDDPDKTNDYSPYSYFPFENLQDRCGQEEIAGICSPVCGETEKQIPEEATDENTTEFEELAAPESEPQIPQENIAAAEKNNDEPKSESAKRKTFTDVSNRDGRIGVPGKIFGETKIVNGRRVCLKNDDRPSKSKENQRWHIDSVSSTPFVRHFVCY